MMPFVYSDKVKVERHDIKIENEDLFELKAWLQEMRETRDTFATNKYGRSDSVRSVERRLAIFEKIMRQLP